MRAAHLLYFVIKDHPLAQMAELFGRERAVITKHVTNVFAEGELGKESNMQNLHIAPSDRPIGFYRLIFNLLEDEMP